MLNNLNTTNANPGSNKARLIRGGKEYFDLIVQLINQANESIHLQTYIFGDDETGVLVADALKAAAKRNVAVYLLIDGYASQGLADAFIDELKGSGINFRFFEPFFKSRQFYFGRRLHHKIFVADARFAITGGVNITNRYNDMPENPAWFDFALFAEGDIARELCELCRKTWNSFQPNKGLNHCGENKFNFDVPGQEITRLVMRRNDRMRRKNEISETYIQMLRHAKSHIVIVCSYFLPGKVIRRLLKNAAKRGVKIQVVTAGRSDVMLSKYAERWLYDWILRKNIELYEYQPTVLHAKISVCDSAWLTIGSYNINNLSAYASIELNIDVYNTSIASQLEATIKKTIEKDCIAITQDLHKRSTNIFKQFIRWLSYQAIRFALYLITLNLKQVR